LGYFKSRHFMESMTFALRGMVHAYRTQRNFRIHLLMALLVILLATAFRMSPLETALLALVIGLVLVAELINTAIESLVDLVTEEYHPLAAAAKNVAAAAVLISSIIAAGVGFLLFSERLVLLHQRHLVRLPPIPAQVTLVGVAAVLIAVLLLKAFGGAVLQLQGGMPSGHAAVAFSLATATFFISPTALPVLFSLAIACLVAQSRVEARIHNVAEVVAGGLLGILLTTLVFQLFW